MYFIYLFYFYLGTIYIIVLKEKAPFTLSSEVRRMRLKKI